MAAPAAAAAEVKRAAEAAEAVEAPGAKRRKLGQAAASSLSALLTDECRAHAKNSAPGNPEQVARLAQMAAQAVERLLRERPHWTGATCEPFGSSVTTLATLGSDLDLSVNLPLRGPDAAARRKSEQKTVKALAGMMRRDPAFVTTQAIPNARVPIVRSTTSVGGLQCDLSIGNELATLNSRLLRAYVLADHRVRPLALVVRAWAKARKLTISEGHKEGVTSYALLLLLLSYLQCQAQPPVLPVLQPPPIEEQPQDADAAPELTPTAEAEAEAEAEGHVATGETAPAPATAASGERAIVQGFDCTFFSPTKAAAEGWVANCNLKCQLFSIFLLKMQKKWRIAPGK